MNSLAEPATGSPRVAPVYLGYEALIRRYQLQVPPLRTVSVGVDRAVERHIIAADGDERVELPLPRLTDTNSLVGQLTFALKRERLNLTVLGALFEHRETLEGVQAWLEDKPSSKYARMAGHLAQWLTGHEFAYKLPPGTPRVPVLDPKEYITGPAVPDTKFGVTHNLVGGRFFSPLIRRTERLDALLAEDLGAKVANALSNLEPQMLARAVDFLYLSETRSTYNIEDEIPDNNRSAKFRRLLEQAGEPGALSEEQLVQWQSQIVGPLSIEASYRNSQNWLSRPGGRLRNIADFIPPPPTLVDSMMDSVAEVAALAAGRGLHPVLAAACSSFGLVYVHPFLDGNGRLHRFLLHHVLRQAGFTPAGVVLPLSARMLKDLPRYSALLKSYSRPRTELLDYLLDAESATILVRSPQPAWLYAYFDATEMCEFILECVKLCVEEDLLDEVAYLRAHDLTVREMGNWLDMRQSQLNTLIDVIVQGHGKLSTNKRKLAEGLSDAEVERMEATVNSRFAEYFERHAP
ncbi:Fic family protein [Variovorax sp. LjRoot130]|uniref:Fic family protein n=1 Tax=Variovorax sp. LjRoot130 TaxID=3342261 RepID=UPI003ECEBE53